MQWHTTELALLSRLLEFAADIQRAEKQVAILGLTPPNWSDTASIQLYAELIDAAEAARALAASTAPLTELARSLEAVFAWRDASPIASRLRDAVVGRDREEYRRGYTRLQMLHVVKGKLKERDIQTATVSEVAPELASAVLADPADPVWDERIPRVKDAWNSARAAAWVRAQKPVDVNHLQSQINLIDSQLQQQISRLAARRAWRHACVSLSLDRAIES